MGKSQSNYEGCKNKLGQKEDHPKDPLMGDNGRLNNKKVTLKGMVNKEKRELWVKNNGQKV
jgi:hypothetical protein